MGYNCIGKSMEINDLRSEYTRSCVREWGGYLGQKRPEFQLVALALNKKQRRLWMIVS